MKNWLGEELVSPMHHYRLAAKTSIEAEAIETHAGSFDQFPRRVGNVEQQHQELGWLSTHLQH